MALDVRITHHSLRTGGLTHVASAKLCADKLKSNATELANGKYILGLGVWERGMEEVLQRRGGGSYYEHAVFFHGRIGPSSPGGRKFNLFS
jgi:hypothetical protein